MRTTHKLAAAGLTAALLATAPVSLSLAAPSHTVTVRHTKLGTILADQHGMTLYLFMKDKKNKSACGGACAQNWPPLLVKGKPSAGKGAQAKLLGTTHRRSGLQVTYNGHPVYRFSGDATAGQTNGEGLNAFGAEWYVLSPKGVKIEAATGSHGYGRRSTGSDFH